jgi:aldose 1-epimerase
VRLDFGEQFCLIDLSGGRVVRYDVNGIPVLTPLELPPSAYPSSLLAPWPNRVAHGAWTWEGKALQLPVNEIPLGSSLHGLISQAAFDVIQASEGSVHLAHNLQPSSGYPFALRIEATYTLSDTGLAASLTATNTGSRTAPVALGVHPYLDTRGPVDAARLTVPATRAIAIDEHWQETDRPLVEGTEWDLRPGPSIADRAIDTTWTELTARDARVRCLLELPGGDTVTVWGGNTCRYVVAYSADTLPEPYRRRTLAVEPCTAPANALRSGRDLDVLAPGEKLTLDWGLTLTLASRSAGRSS